MMNAVVAEFNQRKIVMDSMPSCIYVESVKGCPYTCAMCQAHYSMPQKISSALLGKVEPYFKNLKVLGVHGSGEPTLGDIEYFVSEAKKHDFVLHMNTTGFFLTKRISDMLASARLSIRFSIHAASAETYKRIMGRNFDRIIENISYLVKKDGENKNTSDFWFSFIVMKENINELEDFLWLAHNTGVRHIRFMSLLPTRESIKGISMPDRDFYFSYFEQNSALVRKEFLRRLPFVKKLAQELGINIEAGSMEFAAKNPYVFNRFANKVAKRLLFGKRPFPLKRRRGACVAPWVGQLIIEQNGNVKMCCSADYTLGNIYNSALEDIWNCDKLKKVRASFKEGKFPRICEYCRGLSFAEYPGNSKICKV